MNTTQLIKCHAIIIFSSLGFIITWKYVFIIGMKKLYESLQTQNEENRYKDFTISGSQIIISNLLLQQLKTEHYLKSKLNY